MSHPSKIRYVGLDVHKNSLVIAVADGDRGPATVLATIPNDFATLGKALHRLGPPESLSCCSEAGPTGYGLYRKLKAAGFLGVVIAPSLVPVQAGNRVKTDRRDAAKLAHFLRSGDLTTIHVPDEATEAIRDLERAREDAKRTEQVARHQLTKFLLRHERWYEGKVNWNTAHLAWIGKQQFAQPSQQKVLTDYLVAVEQATERVKRLTVDLSEQVETWKLAPLVKAFQALRGIDLVSAVTIVAEIEDFARFAQAKDLMAFVGLVPSEHSKWWQPPPGPDHADGKWPRATDSGGSGLVLPFSAPPEQNDWEAQRGGSTRCAENRLEGPAEAPWPVAAVEQSRQIQAAVDHGDCAGAGGIPLGDCP